MGNVFVEANEVERGARFLDCRFDLSDASKGYAEYVASHIEGAQYIHLENDLSDMTKNAAGRHPMPEKAQIQALFENLGLSLNDCIYVYDNGAEPFAARAYWMLSFTGFTNVHVVNGGYDALVTAGFPVAKEIPQYEKTSIIPTWNENIFASRSYVHAITQGEKEAVLFDARAAKRYAGEFEPLDPVAGHIPTAKNFDWEQLKEGKTLQPNDALLASVPKDKEVVVYCGSGVTASPLYATLKQAGYENVKLYVGSYSDWINEFDIEK